MISVSRISTTPVKGTALHHPEEVEINWSGVAHNRLFYLIDERNAMFNGKRFGPLVQLVCEYDGSRDMLSVLFPQGETIMESVSPTGERVETSFYGRPVRGTLVGHQLSEAISAYVGAPVRLVRADEPGAGVDVHPVTVLSTATADNLAEQSNAPRQNWRDRFRILIEVDGAEPFEEETWENRTLAVGEAIFSVVGPVPRCVVTTQSPRTGAKDFDTLGALHLLRGVNRRSLSTPTGHLPDGGGLLLGVYATVVSPGIVRRGDPVRVVA